MSILGIFVLPLPRSSVFVDRSSEKFPCSTLRLSTMCVNPVEMGCYCNWWDLCTILTRCCTLASATQFGEYVYATPLMYFCVCFTQTRIRAKESFCFFISWLNRQPYTLIYRRLQSCSHIHWCNRSFFWSGNHKDIHWKKYSQMEFFLILISIFN